MEYDIFFSISQTPNQYGVIPSEAQMMNNYFQQLQVADNLGFGVAWLAQAHLSTKVQKKNRKPVVPHWQGEVGLCTDFPLLALDSFRRTQNIEIGSAVISTLANGGPIALAERIANTVQLHGLDPEEKRKLHLGFSAGRFEFMARPYGIVPRNRVEEAAWPALRGQIFLESCDIFLRLLNGETISSEDTYETVLSRGNFRSDEDWAAVQEAYFKEYHSDHEDTDFCIDITEIPIPKRYVFEDLKIVPCEWRRELIEFVAGTHDPVAQEFVNKILPVKVFNLSITSEEIIDATHARMKKCYHQNGGEWQRRDMPRTTFVFLNAEQGLTSEEQSKVAQLEADLALSSYWKALEGTIDPKKVEKAVDNALIGNVEEVAEQIVARFHPDDRIMAWFDFFNHDSDRICRNMIAFMNEVTPRVDELLGKLV
ncbi:MAG TPA: luciferase [Candidatus Poseidoniales archaeon]|nr:MAG: luciferase [Euryarchaeota archaeon]HIG03319.1 luciferase [Candidatus Poseidoniales archaeon]HIK78567.1 luciferase [Candidatus Poseidoniales archaeon]